MEPVIEARDLTKEFLRHRSRAGLSGAVLDLFHRRYERVRAVDRVNLTVQPGEIAGYIGANGAGKSTTIKMLTGILVPTSGTLRVNGMVPWRDRERFVRTIGVVFGQRSQLWWDIAVQESFRLLQRIYRVPEDQYKRQYDALVEVLELADFLSTPVRKLSLGQRMRCELAAALLHNPPLLFLDEPTIGLDVVVKLRIRDFLHEVNKQYGTTILLTTHDLSDIEALCNRVVMLDKGRIIYDGTLADLKQRGAGGRTVRVTFAAPAALERVAAATAELPVRWERENALTYLCHVADPELTVARLLAALAPDHLVHDVEVLAVSMEEIVRRMYEEGASA